MIFFKKKQRNENNTAHMKPITNSGGTDIEDGSYNARTQPANYTDKISHLSVPNTAN